MEQDGRSAIVLVGVLLGALLGLLNGIVFAYGMVPSFVVTLGSLSIFSGLALQILQGRAITFNSAALDASPSANGFLRCKTSHFAE